MQHLPLVLEKLFLSRENRKIKSQNKATLFAALPVPSPVSMLQVAVVAVLVVPVSCVSQGGFEHSLWTTPVVVLV